jgi:hypothetical protein
MPGTNPTPAKQTQPEQKTEPKKFDDQGHLPETPVENRNMPHVHHGQIEDKGTTTGQTQYEDSPKVTERAAKLQVARAALPTTADDPLVRDPHPDPYSRQLPEEILERDEESLPEKNARRQSQQLSMKQKEAAKDQEKTKSRGIETDPEKKIFNRVNDPLPQQEHHDRAGVHDGAIPGSRSGNALENAAEELLGDKVHDIQSDGTTELKVQNRDKSRAMAAHGFKEEGNDVHKLKISLMFPGINPHVAQKELRIRVGDNNPTSTFLTPDVPNLEVLVHPNKAVHVELTHIDQDGRRGQPYILDFYSNPAVKPRPLEASPIGFEIMETVLVKESEPVRQESPKKEESKSPPQPKPAMSTPKK